jgi:hypothetical protein
MLTSTPEIVLGIEEDEYMGDEPSIKYCPWCGKEITLINTVKTKRIFDPNDVEYHVINVYGDKIKVKNDRRRTLEISETLDAKLNVQQ